MIHVCPFASFSLVTHDAKARMSFLAQFHWKVMDDMERGRGDFLAGARSWRWGWGWRGSRFLWPNSWSVSLTIKAGDCPLQSFIKKEKMQGLETKGPQTTRFCCIHFVRHFAGILSNVDLQPFGMDGLLARGVGFLEMLTAPVLEVPCADYSFQIM